MTTHFFLSRLKFESWFSTFASLKQLEKFSKKNSSGWFYELVLVHVDFELRNALSVENFQSR